MLHKFDITIKRTFIKKILVLVPLGVDNLSSTLSPILGQYGINSGDFLENLSFCMRFLNKDLVLRVRVNIYSNNAFSIEQLDVPFAVFLRGVSFLDKLSFYRLLVLHTVVTEMPSSIRIKYLNTKGYLACSVLNK